MGSEYKTTAPLLALIAAFLCFGTQKCAAQETPVAIENADLWSHYIRPVKMIHSQGTGGSVILDVIVSAGGMVESANAIDGPKKFFSQAEQVEHDRQFKPFEQDGVAVRARIKDWVQIVPPEQWAAKMPFPEPKNLNTLRMSLKRSLCFGPCPAYFVEIDGSGNVVYRGEENVLITGEHHATISRQAVSILLQAFRDADYFSLKDGYAQSVTDSPPYTTSIQFDGHKKSVVDYVGSGVGMPDVVTELEDKIDELADTGKWLHETSETWPSLLSEHWNFRADTEQNLALFAGVVKWGSEELIQSFIAAGAPTLATSNKGDSPLENASARGNLDLVRRMLGNQAHVSMRVLFHSLRAAAQSGNVDLMELLISKGADVNGSNSGNDRDTVLIGAVLSCKKEAVEEILRYHPDVNARDFNGNSALARFLESCPSSADIDGIFELLASAGASVNLKNDQGQTPLFAACWNDRAVPLLAQAGADLNARNDNGQTALMNCVRAEFAKAMIAAGANLSARDRDGHTAAEEARDMGIIDKADVLDAAMKVAKQ